MLKVVSARKGPICTSECNEVNLARTKATLFGDGFVKPQIFELYRDMILLR